MNQKLLATVTVGTSDDQSHHITDFFTKPLNVIHFQDSCGSGRTCRIMLTSIEAALENIMELASVTVVFADDAFDRVKPPLSTVNRIQMSKGAMKTLGILDDEGYVCRTSAIVRSDGQVVAEYPVTSDDELGSHIQDVVLPALRRLIQDQECRS